MGIKGTIEVTTPDIEKLKERCAGLEVEVERLKLGATSLMRIPTVSGQDRVIDARKMEQELALEREITAMLREALKDAKCQCFIRGDQVGKHEIEQALAREKEMRK